MKVLRTAYETLLLSLGGYNFVAGAAKLLGMREPEYILSYSSPPDVVNEANRLLAEIGFNNYEVGLMTLLVGAAGVYGIIRKGEMYRALKDFLNEASSCQKL